MPQICKAAKRLGGGKNAIKLPIRVAIYIRVSTLDQARDGYSLAAQRRVLEQWCRDHNYIIYKVYEDAGISAKDITHRPAMCQMLGDADEGCFDLILIWALSRLTRSVGDLYNTWERLQYKDIGLISYTEAFDTSTPIGRAMMGILGVFAQMEREITAERVRVAMAERAAQGKRTCNDVLGYRTHGKDDLVVHPAEAEIVQYIFDKYLDCHNLSEVSERCRRRGYLGRRGSTISPQGIKIVLTRPVYCGVNSFKGSLYPGRHPPIIPLWQYNAVQILLGRPTVDWDIFSQTKKEAEDN